MNDEKKPVRTLFEKVWDAHEIMRREDGQSLIRVDRHLCEEGSFHAFDMLRAKGLRVREPENSFATPDHYRPSRIEMLTDVTNPDVNRMITTLENNAKEFGVTFFGINDSQTGISHVIGPELGITLPGIVMCGGDSHTPTHGAFGCFAMGVGASDDAHIFAMQSLWRHKPKTMRITIEGALSASVSAKDLALALIARIGAAGGVGHVIEFAGSVVQALAMEGRMTLCNMAAETGAWSGMIAPDDTTYRYLKGRPYAPRNQDNAEVYWRTLPTDDGAVFDCEIEFHVDDLLPMVTWGTSPEDAVPITGAVPSPEDEHDPMRRERLIKALDYMGLTPGTLMESIPVDMVFIGSCTNGRIEDLRAAAAVMNGHKVKVPTLVVPGSNQVRAQAETEGLAKIFIQAGCDWGFSGCSMCSSMNGDSLAPGERSASTSNRNFMGRQGRDSRTHLVSPALAAAAATAGRLCDPRSLKGEH